MKIIKKLIVVTILASVVSCNQANKADLSDTLLASAELESKSDSRVTGSARFEQQGDKVVLLLSIYGASPGLHGVHIHENGDCSAHDGSSSGGHWNPTDDQHGAWGADHYHYGDIGNIKVDSSGNGDIAFKTNKWNLDKDDKFNVINKSIIVHSGEDDLTSQPSGNAGYKVACGVIKLSKR
jgi:Cu-Zn family superoxide dismutase